MVSASIYGVEQFFPFSFSLQLLIVLSNLIGHLEICLLSGPRVIYSSKTLRRLLTNGLHLLAYFIHLPLDLLDLELNASSLPFIMLDLMYQSHFKTDPIGKDNYW